MQRYKKAVDKGLLKVMSKMGISVISSYRGGYNFEAIGLSRALVAEFFPGMPSRISGIGLPGIARKVLEQHAVAWDARCGHAAGRRHLQAAPAWRRGACVRSDADPHAANAPWRPTAYATYRRYAEAVRKLPPVALRDLLDFRTEGAQADLGR